MLYYIKPNVLNKNEVESKYIDLPFLKADFKKCLYF